MKNKKLFLLDVFPILYRSHFAMLNQHLHTTSGLNTSAILGFCNYLFQIIFKEKPGYIAAAFDNPSFHRTAMMGSYKGTREKMPEDISVAKDYVSQIIDALNITTIQSRGHEADDVIGTVALKAAAKGFDVYIVSPDKDFAQLASDNILLYRPSYKGVNFEILDGGKVREKFGVPPSQIVDYLALKGDPSDNIPGVPKIGEKTAVGLLNQYHSLEELLQRKEEISKPSIRQTLTEHEDLAVLSQKLATINTQLDIFFEEEDYRLKGPDVEKLVALLDELEFFRLKERIFSNVFYRKTFEQKVTAAVKDESRKEFQACSPRAVTIAEFDNILPEVVRQGKFYFRAMPSSGYLKIDFLSGGEVLEVNMKAGALPAAFKKMLESDAVEKITYDVKPFVKFMIRHGIHLGGTVSDLLLEHYLISPDANHHYDKVLAQELGIPLQSGLSGVEKNCAQLKALVNLEDKLGESMKADHLESLYERIDLPLVEAIARMEMNGIRIDEDALKEISSLFQDELFNLEQRVYELAGEKFNIRSSRQISELLSKIIKDTPVKKTKTGQLSTSEASLIEFAKEHEIAGQLLRFRKLSKLVSTYTESLPKYVDKQTGRIHAEFLQVSTATGRLSCINPNLQNLPIRSEEGREVRKAVVPDEGYVILSADYSQIELRLLASLSMDEGLREAFAGNKDVHTITAARVFNVMEEDVTDDMRSKAKMVNYGIAYGISSFGLAQRLKIPMSEAKQIIDQYFKEFPRIREFVEQSIHYARNNGYSVTATGRRRHIEDIDSRNGTERRAAERIAINAPIQGLAADLIKLSMIEIDKYLVERGLKTKMIIQVHDELVFEVYQPELEEVAKMVKSKMENALEVAVPLEVNMGVGPNWLDISDINY